MSLFEPELQNLVKLDTVKRMMWKMQRRHVGKKIDLQRWLCTVGCRRQESPVKG